MLTRDEASILHDLAIRAITFDTEGNPCDTPAGFDLEEVTDALATLRAEKDGAGGRALVLEYLRRLAPDLRAGAIDADATPSGARLERYGLDAVDLLRELGGEPPSSQPGRWFARRGLVGLDLPGWLPLEVLDALARIGAAMAGAGIGGIWSAPAMAAEVERQAADGRQARGVLAEVAKLLEVMDPGFDGQVTATAVELARLAFEPIDREGLDANGVLPRGRIATEEVKSLRGSLASILGGFTDRHHEEFRSRALVFIDSFRTHLDEHGAALAAIKDIAGALGLSSTDELAVGVKRLTGDLSRSETLLRSQRAILRKERETVGGLERELATAQAEGSRIKALVGANDSAREEVVGDIKESFERLLSTVNEICFDRPPAAVADQDSECGIPHAGGKAGLAVETDQLRGSSDVVWADDAPRLGVEDTLVLRGLGRRRARGETTGDDRTDALVDLYALATGEARLTLLQTGWSGPNAAPRLIPGARVPAMLLELTPADLGIGEVHVTLGAIARGDWSRAHGRFVTDIGPIDVDRLAPLLAKLFEVPPADMEAAAELWRDIVVDAASLAARLRHFPGDIDDQVRNEILARRLDALALREPGKC